jgi:hypothetical protein
VKHGLLHHLRLHVSRLLSEDTVMGSDGTNDAVGITFVIDKACEHTTGQVVGSKAYLLDVLSYVDRSGRPECNELFRDS